MKLLAVFLHVIVWLPCIAEAQQPTPKTLHLADQAELVSPIAAQARTTNIISPNRRFVVEGDTLFHSQLLTAKELVFKPGARLVFVDTGPATAAHFFIVADKILVEDPNKPGTVTWQRSVPPGPGGRGQAASGAAGSGEGANGGAGPEGATGATGTSGLNAPQLTVFTRNVGAGGLVIDFRGGDGSEGGSGQTGGDGGAGVQGGSASQARHSVLGATVWLPACQSGPGHGGNGGVGGKGGTGGIGGRGGNGGNVTLASTAQNLPTLFQAVRVNMGGGSGGGGGASGVGGNGGAAGPEGPLANFCSSAGRHGSLGGKGAEGARGERGEIGRAGQPFVTEVQDTTFTTLFGF